MRAFARCAVASAVLLTLAAPLPAAAEQLSVAADQVQRIHLRGSAADVVIGNPQIADVAFIDPRTLAVTGKGAGRTSLVVFDRARRVLWEGPIDVSPREGHVSMIRGRDGAAEERIYSCYGACTPRTGQ
jgi:Flp pilus assembly secretin CpaC